MRFEHDEDRVIIRGDKGVLEIPKGDEVAWKFLMLIEGECSSGTRVAAAKRFGFCKQRYYQVRTAFREQGAQGLVSHKRGPQRAYRRDGEATRQIIRYRYLDPDASAEVVGQKLRQDGFVISNRTVYRVFEHYGLQKKGSTNAGPRARVPQSR